MQYTTGIPFRAIIAVLLRWLHVLAVASVLIFALLGRPLDVSAGWIVLPPVVYASNAPRGIRRCRSGWRIDGRAAWCHVRHSWRGPVARSCALAVLWLAGGRVGPAWIALLPWVTWSWQVAGMLCPSLVRQPEWWLVRQVTRQGERLLLGVLSGLALWRLLVSLAQGVSPACESSLSGLGLLCAGPSVQVHHDREGGRYTVELEGRLTLAVKDGDPFRLRLFVLFLLLLEDPEGHRGSRRTRDERTPFVRQQWLAEELGLRQPHISLWLRDWLAGDWRRLLSQHSGEVLTLDLQRRIIETWAHWPSWGIEQIHRFLVAQGVAVTESQVRQAAHESGWQIVRQVLARLCVQRAEKLRLREDWLVGDLLAQLQALLEKVETGQGLTAEEQLDVKVWQAAVGEAGLQAKPPEEVRPWLRRVEQVLFTPWAEVAAEGVCCPACGSSHVGRKGCKPRLKKFVDQHGRVQGVEVYRYRCHNPACSRESFTVFPAGLIPYSSQRLEVHVLALQMYAWGYSTYRRTGKALGVASMTTYRWVSAFGSQLMPVAALFGVVRSSGVVGVDEKWVKVPKNNKPAGDHRKWMYVYVAADAYTYDLLHIAIYPRNTAESAHAFLLALRAKGYHPRVVVTDLRRDYGPAIARVFPQAQHHECLFHASQALHRQLADIYGWGALHDDARVVALCQALDGPLQARTKRTAQRRYDQLMAELDTWVKEKPELAAVFASLEAHWPKLVNGIESDLIPTTNNTVELVIRRFDQHYQNYCGFDSLESAGRFLGVFEKVYRFTPFSDDAQPRIRGKSPLELAGYDVAKLPMAAACNGWAVALPTQTPQESVPSV
ncbi:MAG: IS66 family transposase [Candidatus Nanopelagicales bacterium]